MAPDPADPFADARNNMVDSQVRPNKVTDPRILAAMRTLPRERFLPAEAAALAYVDEDVPLGHGRVLLEPMVLARLLQTAEPVDGERALIVGAGVGYGAAVLAACGCRVTALEEDAALHDRARAVLAEFAPGVAVVSGPLAAGWPAGAPYDIIVIEGAVPEIPATIGQQLRAETGRLLTVLRRPGGPGQAVLAECIDSAVRARPIFDCATPLLPMFQPAPAFQF
jgi:protein-L-isoaspartate(D-aspartate) O-methyltransferase